MAYILGALESPNSGAQKCIGKWLRENDSFKKYRTFCILFAIIGSFCFVLPHSCLQSICRTQCQLSDAFKKVKFGLCTKEIWTNLNIYVLPIFQPQKFRQIYISYNHWYKLLIAFIRSSIYPRVPELWIYQEIGLSEYLLQHFIRGQTILFIHENILANYHRLLISHPPP